MTPRERIQRILEEWTHEDDAVIARRILATFHKIAGELGYVKADREYCPSCGGSGDDTRMARPGIKYSTGVCPTCKGNGVKP